VARYAGTDLLLTPDGDLLVGEEGDLLLTRGTGYVVQSIYNRLKSVSADWFYDQVGADLEDFLGQPNSSETGAAVEERIISALTGDGLLAPEDLLVKVVPAGETQLACFVFARLAGAERPFSFRVTVDLEGGVSVHHQ
jgi:hypothetical protein